MNKNVTTIHITKALSSSMIVDLMDEYPNLEEITCSPSVYKRTSRDYIEALRQLDIEVKTKYEWGAKSKSNGIEFYVKKLSDEGLTAKQISQRLDISLNRVYYLLIKSNADYNNRKYKHDHSKVKQLKEDGFSAKEISEKLDMPLRSVYYILRSDKIRLPIKSVVGILKNAGAQRTSADAKIEFAKVLTEKAYEISQKAVNFADCEGRKTVKSDDIKLAIKLIF